MKLKSFKRFESNELDFRERIEQIYSLLPLGVTKENVHIFSDKGDGEVVYSPLSYEINYIYIDVSDNKENLQDFIIQLSLDEFYIDDLEEFDGTFDFNEIYIPIEDLKIEDIMWFYGFNEDYELIEPFDILNEMGEKLSRIYNNKYAVLEIEYLPYNQLLYSHVIDDIIDDLYLITDEEKATERKAAIEYITDKLIIDYKSSILKELNNSLNDSSFMVSKIVDDKLAIKLTDIVVPITIKTLKNTILKTIIYDEDVISIHIETDGIFHYIDEYHKKRLNNETEEI